MRFWDKDRPFLYLITNRHLFPDIQKFLDTLDVALSAGVDILQLREKDLSTVDLYNLACDVRDLCKRYGTIFLINDRADIAMAVEADGVHLTEQSLPSPIARKILGTNKIIGRSLHKIQDIDGEARAGADFITFSPVFYTESKARYGSPQGIKRLKDACMHSNIPVVALGGININNVDEVLTAGVCGVAVISAVLGDDDPEKSVGLFRKLLETRKVSF